MSSPICCRCVCVWLRRSGHILVRSCAGVYNGGNCASIARRRPVSHPQIRVSGSQVSCFMVLGLARGVQSYQLAHRVPRSRDVVTNPFPTPPPLPDEQDADRRRRPAHIQITQNWYFATPPPAGTNPQYEVQVVTQAPTEHLPVPRAGEARAGAPRGNGINRGRVQHAGNVPIDGVRDARLPPAQHRGGNGFYAQGAATNARADDANAAPGQIGTRTSHQRRYYTEFNPNLASNTASASSFASPARVPPSPRPTPPHPPPPPAPSVAAPAASSAPVAAPTIASATVPAPPVPAPRPVPPSAPAPVLARAPVAATTAQIPMANPYNPNGWGPVDPIWTPEHRGRGYGPYRPHAQGGMCSTASNPPHRSTFPRSNSVSILPQSSQLSLSFIVPSNQAPPIPYDPDLEGAPRCCRVVRLLLGYLRRIAPCATDARTRANTEANRRSSSRGSNASQRQGHPQARALPTPPYDAPQAPAQNAWYVPQPQNVPYVQPPQQPQMYWAACPHCQMPGAHHAQCPFYQQAVARSQAVPMQQPDRNHNASRATNRSNASQSSFGPAIALKYRSCLC